MKKRSILNLFPNHSDAPIMPVDDSELPLVGALTRREFLFVAGAAPLTPLAGTKSQAKSGSGRPTVGAGSGRIDVHHHFIPPQYLKEGPRSVATSKVEDWSPAHAIEDMDRTGVAISVLSFASPYLWFPGLDDGRRLARLCNDYSAQIVRDHPHRFGLFAGVPPLTDIEGSLYEIAYALDQLHAQGITVMTSYGNSWLGDPAFAPVWNELNRRDAIVFVHPAIPVCCASLGQGVPSSYLELPFDSARAVASLWFNGALEQYSRIRFIFSHGGGALPMVADRIDKFGRPGKEPGTRPHDALTQFDELYFDTANAANPAALAGLRAIANPRHILFGTDYPYVPLERGVDGLARANISSQHRRSIQSDNALSLMPGLVS